MPAFVGFLVNVVIIYAVSWAINYFFGKKADPRIFSPKFEDNQAQVRSAVESHKIVYGKSLTSGPLTFAAANGAANQYMHVVVPLTGHEVEAIDTVYFDDISSNSSEFNKLDTWKIVGYANVAERRFEGYVTIDGIIFGGGSTQSWEGDHSRLNMTKDVMYGLYRSITGSTGYAARNYTAAWDGNFTVTITAKVIGTEISIQELHPANNTSIGNGWMTVGGLGSPTYGALLAVHDSYVNDIYLVLVTKAHIFDVYKHLGSTTQVADSNLVAENVGWTSAHRLRGRSYLYAKLAFYADRWPTGIPNLKAEVRGRKCYDPRSALTVWSANPAICIRDYLTATFGLGATSAEIDDTSLIAAANICDEYVLSSSPKTITSSSVANPTVITATAHKLRTGDEVVVAGHTGSTPSINGNYIVTVLSVNTVTVPVNATVGGTGGTLQLRQKRYACNGTITLGERPIDVIQKMLTCCDGTLVYSEGKYKLFVGAYTAPVGDLNESNLRDGLRIVANPPRKQLFNGVRGTILDPNRFWQETDFPVYKNSTYATDDSEEIIRDITLPFTTDAFAAQRIAKQILERSRQGITVVFPAKLNAFKFSVNDVVRLSISYLGWTNKEFRILSWSLTDFGVDVTLQEEASASYNWNNGDETIIDPAPNSNLPSVFTVAMPTGVTAVEELYQSANTTGIKTRIKVTWSASADTNVVEYVVYWFSFSDSKQAASGTSSAHSAPLRGTKFYIEDISPGYYYVGIKSFNDIGFASAETALVQIIVYGNTVNPENVTGFNAYQNGDLVVFTWSPISDVDLLGYEVRYGTAATSVWETATQITRAERGTEITSALIPPGDWKFFIKAQDTTLLYSVTAATDNVLVISQSNLVSSVEHEPGWLGTTTNFVRHWTGKLIPDDQNLASFYTNFEWCDTYVPTPFAVCTYVTTEVDTIFDDTLRAWAGAEHALGPGVVVGAANVLLEVDYHTTAGAYDGYETTSIGFREGRYWKFRLTHDTTIGKGVITEFQTALDKQAVTQSEQSIAIASGGSTVNFPTQYHTRPTVSVAPQGATPLVAAISSVTTTGFTVRLYDTAGIATAGSIDYYATGA